jgi:uncharacterized protein (TIGR02001 family)
MNGNPGVCICLNGAGLKSHCLAWVLVLLVCSTIARAEVSATLTATNDYDFRGESQTAYAPAAQVCLEMTSDSGWKGGLFTSNVNFGRSRDWGNPRLEMNPYAEFSHKVTSGASLGVGVAYYAYMVNGGASYDYGEIYLSGGYKSVKSALYYAPAYDGRSTRQHLSAWYWSADNTLPLVEHFSMLNHVGYAWGPYWAHAGGGAKIDYSVDIDYSIRKFDVILQFIDTKRTSAGAGEPGNTKGRAVLSFEMAIPW